MKWIIFTCVAFLMTCQNVAYSQNVSRSVVEQNVNSASGYLDSGYYLLALHNYQLAKNNVESNELIPVCSDLYLECMIKLSKIYYVLDKHDTSNYYADQAILFTEKNLSSDHESLARSYIQKANLLNSIGSEESLKYLEIVSDKIKSGTTFSNDILFNFYSIQAEHCELNDQFEDAEALLKQAFSYTNSENKKDYVRCLRDLGRVIYFQGRFEEALDTVRSAIKIAQTGFQPKSPRIARLHEDQAIILMELGEFEESLHNYRKAVDIYVDVFGEISSKTSYCYYNMALCYDYLGKDSLALEYLEKDLKISKIIYGEKSLEVAEAYKEIANTSTSLGNEKYAIQIMRKSIKLHKQLFKKDNLYVGHCYFTAASVFTYVGKEHAGLKYAKKSLNIYTELFGMDHYWTERARKKVKSLRERKMIYKARRNE